MSNESLFVFGLIVVAAAMMASNRVRYDVVALLVVIALHFRPSSHRLAQGRRFVLRHFLKNRQEIVWHFI